MMPLHSLWTPHLWMAPHPWLLVPALVCSLGPALLFLLNLRLYQPPPTPSQPPGPVSVLIPARNEELSIGAAVRSVLATPGTDRGGITVECIVLDDASTDRTAAVVSELAALDARLRLAQAPPLPAGWNGKQHACHVLAGLAQYPVLCFLDADVRVAPDALPRLAGFLGSARAQLVSGFPLEETGSLFEHLLIPLIHFVLLGFLPLARARSHPSDPALAAGCGQIMLVERAAYTAVGGHGSIRATMHDGLLLPRLFRRHGFATDLCDLTQLARCRMYHTAAGTWAGLAKNATEGMAAPARIVPFTLLLAAGQVLPLVLAFVWPTPLTLLALGASYLPRLVAASRFRQSWLGALLHPMGIVLLLVLQWYALGRKLVGGQATWKARSYDVG